MSEAAKLERQGVEMLPHPEAGKTRDKVAAAIGLGSGRSFSESFAKADPHGGGQGAATGAWWNCTGASSTEHFGKLSRSESR